MYNWRQMSSKQREDVLRMRKINRVPWHSPPHRDGDSTRFHITAACYRHQPVIGFDRARMSNFESVLLEKVDASADRIMAWVVLPNHYHILIRTDNIKSFLHQLGRFHGSMSYSWNGEENRRGRKVWCNALEHAIKTDRHFWATLNYIHHNPVRHGYVDKWQDWPFSSALKYLESVGRKRAKEVWKEFPIREYGKDWDPPGI